MASPLPTVIIVPIATLCLGAFGLISGPVLQSIKDSEPRSKYQIVDSVSETKDVAKGGVRVIIVNSKNSWEKAVKISKRKAGGGWEFVKEVKCGDKSGKVAKSNSSIKYDVCRIDFDGVSEFQFEYRKPEAFGIWVTPLTVQYSLENQKQINGRTYYIYFDNDDDGYFTQHPENRLVASKLL